GSQQSSFHEADRAPRPPRPGPRGRSLPPGGRGRLDPRVRGLMLRRWYVACNVHSFAQRGVAQTARPELPDRACEGGALAMSTTPERRIIKGKYRLDRWVATGGMGALWAGFDQTLRRRVAIKFLNESVLGNIQLLCRFTQEARLAAQVAGAHVVQTY